MEGPRPPVESEYPQVLDFLDDRLRPNTKWSIASEYPTALGLQNLNNIRIITDAERVLSHAVLKPLIVKTPNVIFKIGAIGSVVTDESHRNQGLSRMILENCLEEARRQDCDIALLWTNLYDFYRKLNFELGGSEVACTFNEEFSGEIVGASSGLKFIKGHQISAEALYRLYSQHTVGSIRSVEDIRKFLAIPQTQLTTAWDNQGQLVAYAVEGKGIDLTGYVHEWGGRVAPLLALFSYLRKERQSPFTVILPQHSENLLRALEKLPVSINHGYLGMIKIVNFEGLAGKIRRAARNLGVADLILERQKRNDGTTETLFGLGKDIVAISDDKALIQVLFGPFPMIDSFEEQTKKTLAKLFPLPLWIWGWDSV
jgi:GNAT superfamily N-acetyltransferase